MAADPDLAKKMGGVIPPPLKSDVEFAERYFRGLRYFVVKDRLAERFFRLSPEEAMIAGWFDGISNLLKITERAAREFPHMTPAIEEVFGFYRRLSEVDLLAEDPEGYVIRREKRETARTSALGLWSRGVGKLLFIKFPLVNPNAWIGRFAPIWKALFSPIGLSVFLLVWFYALLGFFSGSAGGAQLDFKGAFSIPLVWLALALSKSLHEIGHAATCKAYGGNVNEMGISLICLTPCGYVDASDAWMMDNRWKRIAVSVAGIYTELFLGGIAAIVWLHSSEGLLHSFAFSLLLIATINTLFFNLNPLMRFDGYYLMLDLLDIPNLRTKALGWVGGYLKRFFFGTPRPEVGDGNGAVFAFYSIAAFSYIIVISISIGMIFLRFLDPVGLRGLGMGLGAVLLFSLLGLPVFKAIRETSSGTSGVTPSKAFGRGGMILSIFVFLIAGFLLLPTHHVVSCQGVVEPIRSFTAVAPVSGFLVEVAASEGQQVDEGQLLLKFEDAELGSRYRAIRSNREREEYLFRSGLRREEVVSSAASVHASNAEALRTAEERIAARLDSLSVSSPLGGTVLSLQGRDPGTFVGQWFSAGSPILRVAAGGDREIVAAVPERDARVLSAGDSAKAMARGPAERFDATVQSVSRDLSSSSEIRSGHLAASGGVVPVGSYGRVASALESFPVVLVSLGPTEHSSLDEMEPGQRVKVRINGADTNWGGRIWRRVRLFWVDRTGG